VHGPAVRAAEPGGKFWTIWLSHSIFALPLAIYLLHNMKEVPGRLIEAARVDGAGHVRIFTKIMLPLMAPAIAAFGIFQFLWVWNDLLVPPGLRRQPGPRR
jgi:alpha-glucoside transport system permease protein